MQYTIAQVKPTGEAPSSFGTKYHVQFEGVDGAVTVTKQKEPQIGDVLDGEIKQSPKFGAYFKKTDTPFVPKQEAAAPAARAWTPAPKNNDGQRQGMCINNAANFVNAKDGTLGYNEWATEVHAYASALYALGDLNEEKLTNPFEN